MPTTSQKPRKGGGRRTFDENVSDVVRVLMSVRKLTRVELAPLVGIKQSTLYERFKGVPWKADELDRLARFFDVPPRVFFEPVENIIGRLSPWITARDKSITQMSLLDAIAV